MYVYHEDKKIGCSSLTITLLNLIMIVSSSRPPPGTLSACRGVMQKKSRRLVPKKYPLPEDHFGREI
jgi:hypothetical protein